MRCTRPVQYGKKWLAAAKSGVDAAAAAPTTVAAGVAAAAPAAPPRRGDIPQRQRLSVTLKEKRAREPARGTSPAVRPPPKDHKELLERIPSAAMGAIGAWLMVSPELFACGAASEGSLGAGGTHGAVQRRLLAKFDAAEGGGNAATTEGWKSRRRRRPADTCWWWYVAAACGLWAQPRGPRVIRRGLVGALDGAAGGLAEVGAPDLARLAVGLFACVTAEHSFVQMKVYAGGVHATLTEFTKRARCGRATRNSEGDAREFTAEEVAAYTHLLALAVHLDHHGLVMWGAATAERLQHIQMLAWLLVEAAGRGVSGFDAIQTHPRHGAVRTPGVRMGGAPTTADASSAPVSTASRPHASRARHRQSSTTGAPHAAALYAAGWRNLRGVLSTGGTSGGRTSPGFVVADVAFGSGGTPPPPALAALVAAAGMIPVIASGLYRDGGADAALTTRAFEDAVGQTASILAPTIPQPTACCVCEAAAYAADVAAAERVFAALADRCGGVPPAPPAGATHASFSASGVWARAGGYARWLRGTVEYYRERRGGVEGGHVAVDTRRGHTAGNAPSVSGSSPERGGRRKIQDPRDIQSVGDALHVISDPSHAAALQRRWGVLLPAVAAVVREAGYSFAAGSAVGRLAAALRVGAHTKLARDGATTRSQKGSPSAPTEIDTDTQHLVDVVDACCAFVLRHAPRSRIDDHAVTAEGTAGALLAAGASLTPPARALWRALDDRVARDPACIHALPVYRRYYLCEVLWRRAGRLARLDAEDSLFAAANQDALDARFTQAGELGALEVAIGTVLPSLGIFGGGGGGVQPFDTRALPGEHATLHATDRKRLVADQVHLLARMWRGLRKARATQLCGVDTDLLLDGVEGVLRGVDIPSGGGAPPTLTGAQAAALIEGLYQCITAAAPIQPRNHSSAPDLHNCTTAGGDVAASGMTTSMLPRPHAPAGAGACVGMGVGEGKNEFEHWYVGRPFAGLDTVLGLAPAPSGVDAAVSRGVADDGQQREQAGAGAEPNEEVLHQQRTLQRCDVALMRLLTILKETWSADRPSPAAAVQRGYHAARAIRALGARYTAGSSPQAIMGCTAMRQVVREVDAAVVVALGVLSGQEVAMAAGVLAATGERCGGRVLVGLYERAAALQQEGVSDALAVKLVAALVRLRVTVHDDHKQLLRAVAAQLLQRRDHDGTDATSADHSVPYHSALLSFAQARVDNPKVFASLETLALAQPWRHPHPPDGAYLREAYREVGYTTSLLPGMGLQGA